MSETRLTDENAWLDGLEPDAMRRIIDALYRVHTLIPAMADLDTLLERILIESQEVADAEASSVLLYDEEKDDLFFHVALGDDGDQDALKSVVRLKMGQGIAGQAALNDKIIRVDDAHADERFFREADETSEFTTRSLLAVPMKERGKLVGVLEVLNKKGGGPFTEVDERVMTMFSLIAADVVDSARLIEEKLAAERLAAIGQAVAGLSHYTKNLVAGLSGSVELIDQGLETGNNEYLERSWPVFKRSTKRVTNFVADMLAYSKDREPLRSEVELSQIFEDVAETFWGLLSKKEVVLTMDASDAAKPVYLEADALHRCLINLVVNAADAVETGTGKIHMGGALRDDGTLEVTVSDNGPGIDEELRNKIFEPFFSTKGARGTGLGLAVTSKIVNEHGGEITVGTGPEGGAAFVITMLAKKTEG